MPNSGITPSPGIFYECKYINEALRAGLPDLSGSGNIDAIRTPIVATYLNYLITNGLVILPAYDMSTDDSVVAIFQDLYPEREIYTMNPTLYNRRSGGIHCLTILQPCGTMR